MVDLPTICKYDHKTKLVAWDPDAGQSGNFVEEDGTIHTYERCLEIQHKAKAAKSGKISNYSNKPRPATGAISYEVKNELLAKVHELEALVEAL